jgi:hemin uptake protein HemP
MSADEQRTKTGGSFKNRMKSSGMVDSYELLGDNQRVIIKHRGENYCLRITRKDKLILTK